MQMSELVQTVYTGEARADLAGRLQFNKQVTDNLRKFLCAQISRFVLVLTLAIPAPRGSAPTGPASYTRGSVQRQTA